MTPKTGPDTEQAILDVVFAALGVRRGYFVDVGAWDGVRLSNTRRLAEAGWSGLMIEADRDRFAELTANAAWPGVRAVHRHVTPTGTGALDAILAEQGAPASFDLLDVDIDSDDLAVWLAMERHRATCVLIEYNNTIPFDTEFINPLGHQWGNAARSIVRVAQGLGYRLVGITASNLVLVDLVAGEAAGLPAKSLADASPGAGKRYFWGHDGTLIVGGAGGAAAPESIAVPLHDFRFPQPMPPRLRRWSVDGRHRPAERRASAVAAMLRPVRGWQARRAARRHPNPPSKGT